MSHNTSLVHYAYMSITTLGYSDQGCPQQAYTQGMIANSLLQVRDWLWGRKSYGAHFTCEMFGTALLRKACPTAEIPWPVSPSPCKNITVADFPCPVGFWKTVWPKLLAMGTQLLLFGHIVFWSLWKQAECSDLM